MSIHVQSVLSRNVYGLLKTTKKENSRPVQPTDKVHKSTSKLKELGRTKYQHLALVISQTVGSKIFAIKQCKMIQKAILSNYCSD